jgi:hypothetical protein
MINKKDAWEIIGELQLLQHEWNNETDNSEQLDKVIDSTFDIIIELVKYTHYLECRINDLEVHNLNE